MSQLTKMPTGGLGCEHQDIGCAQRNAYSAYHRVSELSLPHALIHRHNVMLSPLRVPSLHAVEPRNIPESITLTNVNVWAKGHLVSSVRKLMGIQGRSLLTSITLLNVISHVLREAFISAKSCCLSHRGRFGNSQRLQFGCERNLVCFLSSRSVGIVVHVDERIYWRCPLRKLMQPSSSKTHQLVKEVMRSSCSGFSA